jgi:hypothetical protein
MPVTNPSRSLTPSGNCPMQEQKCHTVSEQPVLVYVRSLSDVGSA